MNSFSALFLLAIVCVVVASKAPALAPVVVPKVNSRKTQLANFFAGGLAGTISSTLTMPLEIVKTQLQSSRIGKSSPRVVAQQIMQNEGPKGFFKGIKPMIVGIVPTRAIYFWAYSTTKSTLSFKLGNGPANHVLSAFAAGIASNTVMNPLWMVKTRFQIMADASVGQRAFENYRDVAKSIWKEEGIGGFFKGISASYVGCFEGAIQWIVYEKLKTALSTPKLIPSLPQIVVTPRIASRFSFFPKSFSDKDLAQGQNVAGTPIASVTTTRTPRPVELFLAAALSKGVAVLATYPHEVVRTRLREQATSGVFKYKGFFGALSTIAKEEGRRGLYSGMGMHLLRSVPNAAVMFLSFELVSTWLEKENSLLNKLELPKIDISNSTLVSSIAKH